MAGVYISYPFCSQKCTYCNFASGVFPRHLELEYLECLERGVRSAVWPWTPKTIYLGGGTPGSMDPGALRRLLEPIPGRPWKEATIEAAPASISAEYVRAWREAGIGRVSLGVQSFVNSELRWTGRKHDAAGVSRDVALLRSEGIEEINIDLIAGLPSQTAESWGESLDWIEKLQPPHVSVYLFEVDEDSRLGTELLHGGQRYGAGAMPGDDLMAGFYEEAVRRLDELGLRRYEISNFARPGHESHHNLKYWRIEPYLGFGSDAHSFDGKRRWRNPESPQEYVAKGGESRLDETAADPNECLWVGLRLMEGVMLSERQASHFSAALMRLEERGLLVTRGRRARLTPRGVLLSNDVFAEFIESCPDSGLTCEAIP